MKLKTFAVAAALVAVIASPAEAKYIVQRLTVSGPGMEEPAVIKKRMVVNIMQNATLRTYTKILPANSGRIERPGHLGPAYVLEYRFGVGDNDGFSTQSAHQRFYPFAAGGPVVFTPAGQKLEMSFGDVRFGAGWFEVDERMLPSMKALGVPDSAPTQPQPTGSPPSTPPPTSPWPLIAAATLLVGAGALVARRRLV